MQAFIRVLKHFYEDTFINKKNASLLANSFYGLIVMITL
jgi:hypothetical protein